MSLVHHGQSVSMKFVNEVVPAGALLTVAKGRRLRMDQRGLVHVVLKVNTGNGAITLGDTSDYWFTICGWQEESPGHSSMTMFNGGHDVPNDSVVTCLACVVRDAG